MTCENGRESARRASDGRTLYLECQSGIAGDMLVGALLDLDGEAAERAMARVLASLPLTGCKTRVSRVSKAGIDCCDFAVELDQVHENHDHDMAYLHGAAEHGHEHEHHSHRGMADIRALIDAADMTSGARALATKAFEILAEAEAKAHGIAVSHVHFHEVGAVDSIVDIVVAAVLIDHLRIGRTVLPVLFDGHGTIRCQHGIIPVPVPATLNICIAHALPLAASDIEGELVTPTGAALAAALEPLGELPARYRVRAVGLGAGKRSYERPSILRACLIEELDEASVDEHPEPGARLQASVIDPTAPDMIMKLECDIDDSTGEALAFAAERLREAGACEVHWISIFTKKGRPAYQLEVICAVDDARRLERVVFRETSTLGVRRQRMERICLERSIESVMSPWGAIDIKRATSSDGSTRFSPEYEDCARIAREQDIPLGEVMAAALRSAEIGERSSDY